MSWDKPCLHRVRDAVLDAGYKAFKISNNQFRCQCPAHQGHDFNLQFKLQPSGKISFRCFSHDCGMKEMLLALDLFPRDFYVDAHNYHMDGTRKKRGPDPSLDDWCLVTARDNRANGMALTKADKQREFEAFMRRRNGILSPEVA